MKIEKGHYVPKELITSKAVHEAVVKAFVAAGFVDARPEFGVYKTDSYVGLGTYSDGEIIWINGGSHYETEITLQQLFTAENGLQWPSFATEIRTDDNAVWFFGGGQAEHICGSIHPIPYRVLATHQPKEKEVGEVLDKSVIEHNGLWPDFNWIESKQNKHAIVKTVKKWQDVDSGDIYRAGHIGKGGTLLDPEFCELVCTKDQFTQRAKELGFINGYRWGVEYPTNGKRPDLDGDVMVEVKINNHHYKNEWSDYARRVDTTAWGSASVAFKITDQRYKPADTSYLQTPAVEPVEEVAQGDWWDYENKTLVEGRHPPVGTKCEYSAGISGYEPCEIVAVNYPAVAFTCPRNSGSIFVDTAKSAGFRPLDHATRKAEMERKALIQQGYEIVGLDTTFNVLEKLIDAGWRPTK